MKELTKGEIVVRTNYSANDKVGDIKKKYAELIDIVEDVFREKVDEYDDDSTNREVMLKYRNLYSVKDSIISKLREASMLTVFIMTEDLKNKEE